MTHLDLNKLQANFFSEDIQWTQRARCDDNVMRFYLFQLLKRELRRQTSNLNLAFINVLLITCQVFAWLRNLHKELIRVILIVQQVTEPFIKPHQVYNLETLLIFFYKILDHESQRFNDLLQTLLECFVHELVNPLREEYLFDVSLDLMSVWSIRKADGLPVSFLLIIGRVECLEETVIDLFEIHPLLLKVVTVITLRVWDHSA